MLKKALKFSLCLLPIAIVVGILSGLQRLGTPRGMHMIEVLEDLGGKYFFIALRILPVAIQVIFYGFFGYILANKVGLWRHLSNLKKKKLNVALIVAVVFILYLFCFLVFSLKEIIFQISN